MATSVGHSVVVRRVAMAVATVDLLGVVCLILFSLSVVPSGPSTTSRTPRLAS
jgi:hypothetical protein